ncbi:MAG TPA: ABC transporter substrate-binding protein [Stellaceae bacterium]|nr:ABC transporter substrate-binding protein [Stellaceae bacterium]
MRQISIQVGRSGSIDHRPNLKGERALSSPLKRRSFLTALLPFLLATRKSSSATVGSPARIGWLKIQGARHTPGQLKAFREGMSALGLVEGRDYELEERYADGDQARLPSLTSELIGTGVSIILATSQPSIAAAARVTKRVPVIGRMNDDPVADGMAQSLARPGGNITGIYAMTEELNPKRLALLKEVAPSVRRVGVLLRHDSPNAEHDWQVAEAAARKLNLELLALDAHAANDLTAALAHASANNVDGIMTFRNPTVVTYLKLIAELCQKYRLPAVFDAREYVEAGGLVSYGPNIDAIYGQLANYVGKLLRGIPPGELPIEQPTTFELVINKRTANVMGLPLPASLLVQADAVIE